MTDTKPHSQMIDLIAENNKLRKLLKPFANCVYNDNHDMSVDSSTAKYDDFIAAYFAVRHDD